MRDIEKGLVEHCRLILGMKKGVTRDTSSIAFLGMEDCILQHGAIFTPRPGPVEESDRREQGACFSNCQKVIVGLDQMTSDSLVYCEGYAVKRRLGIAIHHGWLVDSDGVVLDPTWRDIEAPDSVAYFGIAFRPDYIRQHVKSCMKKGVWFSVLDNYGHDWPLLTGKHPISKAALPTDTMKAARRPEGE